MSGNENIHIDVEGETAEAPEVERAAATDAFIEALATQDPRRAMDEARRVIRPAGELFTTHRQQSDDPTLVALSSRARDLSLAITNPATLARKLRESLIELVGPEHSRAYHIGASYDSEKGEVQFQIATVTPNFLARLQVEQGTSANRASAAKLEVAYLRTVNGWEVAVGAGVTAIRRSETIDKDDVAVGASFSVTVRK